MPTTKPVPFETAYQAVVDTLPGDEVISVPEWFFTQFVNVCRVAEGKPEGSVVTWHVSENLRKGRHDGRLPMRDLCKAAYNTIVVNKLAVL